LIFAQIGLSAGVLSSELFSAILLMVIGTTFVAPFLLKWSFRRSQTSPSPAS
jgi:Na+:H+ antiporter